MILPFRHDPNRDAIEMIHLMAGSPTHCTYSVSRIQGVVFNPIACNQYLLFVDDATRGVVGSITWAWLSDEASDLHSKHLLNLHELRNWDCGENLWAMDLITTKHLPMAAVRSILKKGFPPNTTMRWTRTHGTGSVQHVGKVTNVQHSQPQPPHPRPLRRLHG